MQLNLIGKGFCLLLSAVITSTVHAAEFEVGQKDKTFVKDGGKVETFSIKAGDTVNFKNMDPFFHNVFSLSDLKTFDLGSYPQGQFKAVKFDAPGTAEIECAIHPQMHLVIEVKP